MALVIVGTATRPAGSDSWPPIAGTKVPYAYAQPIVDLDKQADAYGWLDLGIFGGNFEHLSKHGGHTPWRANSKRGIIWAMDRKMPDDFEAWLVAKCRSNYDTMWIRFFNINGRQYSGAGVSQGSSPDYHLHLEIEDGTELRHVTLFEDYATEKGLFTVADNVKIDQILNLLVNGTSPTGTQTTGGGVPRVEVYKELYNLGIDADEIDTQLDVIEARIAAIPSGGNGPIDYAAMAKAIVDEFARRLNS